MTISGATSPGSHVGARQMFLAAVLFSTGGVAIKATDLDASTVTCLRSAIAVPILALAVRLPRRAYDFRALLVGVAHAGTLGCFIAATKYTTASAAIFLENAAPLYVALLAPLLLNESLRRRDVGFLAALAIGLALLLLDAPPDFETAPDPRLGNAFGVAAGVFWALTMIGFRWVARTSEEDGAAAACGVFGNAIACVAMLPWLSLVRADGATATWTDATAVVWLGVFQLGLAYVLFSRAAEHLTALTSSLILLSEPVLLSIWVWLAFGEHPGPLGLAGSALILTTTAARAVFAVEGPTAESQ